MERAQHAGDVAQRRPLETALAERPMRFALEIDEDKIFAGVQHLAEMQIPVNANALRIKWPRIKALEEADDRALGPNHLVRKRHNFI
jgi:hypothetical protein